MTNYAKSGQKPSNTATSDVCPQCHGKGFLAYDVPSGHPLYDKVVPCECKRAQFEAEKEQRRMAHLERICGLTNEMRTWTFENTKSKRPDCKNYPAAFDAARQLAAEPEWFLTLHGSYGVGKTRLLACIVNAGLAAGITSVYTTTSELLDHLRATFGPGSQVGFDELWDTVENAKILALDEADRYHSTAWAQDKFDELIGARYRAGAERMTVFATNAEIADLPAYLTSRMRDRRCKTFELVGADMRQVRA